MVSIYFAIIGFVSALPFIKNNLDLFKLGSLSLSGIIRAAMLPALFLYLITPSKKKKNSHNVNVLLIGTSGMLLWCLVQNVFISPTEFTRGLRGLGDFLVCWSILLCGLIKINYQNAKYAIRIVPSVMAIFFIAIFIQYPFVIAKAWSGFKEILVNYSRGNKEIHSFIFNFANEESTLLVAAYPFAVKMFFKKNKTLNIILTRIISCILIFFLYCNQSRTALFIAFPMVLILLNYQLETKKIIALFILAFVCWISFEFLIQKIIQYGFSKEMEGAGGFNYRIHKLWLPALEYTFKNAPFWGFGANSWLYIHDQTGLFVEHASSASKEAAILPGYNVWILGPHSNFVYVLTSWGIVGLSIYLAIFLKLFITAYKLTSSRFKEIRNLARIGLSSMSALLCYNIINNPHEAGWFFFVLVVLYLISLETLQWCMDTMSRNKIYYSATEEP
ncbi:MAG: O-antigen ligase family protein [Candidatus Omnitrophota bacterium]